jgi:putative ATP-binding cassette transporter
MEPFTPSLDWGDELITSVLWVAKAWVIGAACTLVVLALIGRFTKWGRQFWRVTGGYFKGRESIPVWLWLGVLLLSVMIDVRLSVLFSYQSNDQFSALQAAFEGEGAAKDSAIESFWWSILILVALAAVDIVRTVLDLYLMQRFIIRWRVWLTHRLTADWLDGDAYYRGRFIDNPIDNADQRIQQDIDIFITGTGPETNTPTVGTAQTLVFGAVTSIVSVVSFTPILWRLAGPLTIFGVTVPKALFWMALVYVFLTTVVAFWIGHPLIRLSFRNELTNAAFRYALMRLRDAGEAIGFYRGEGAERGRLMTRFAAVIANYRAFVRRGGGVPRLELVGVPDRRPAADDRSGPPVVRRTDSARRHHPVVERVPTSARLAVVLSSRLRLVRQLPGRHYSPRRDDRRERNSKGTTGVDGPTEHRRFGGTRRSRGAHTGRCTAR